MPKRVLQGRVVSAKGDKTAVVVVERTFKHALYAKTLRKSKKYHAHDAENRCQEGDVVRISECKPISKLKRFEVIYGQDASENA